MTTRRATLMLVFLGLIWASWPRESVGQRALAAPAASVERSRYEHGRDLVRILLSRSPGAIPQQGREPLREALQQLQTAIGNWAAAAQTNEDVVARSRWSAEAAMMRILAVLDASDATLRVGQPEVRVRRRWPSRSSVLILRIGRPGAETDTVPDYVIQEADIGAAGSVQVDVPEAATVYAALFLDNVPSGVHEMQLTLSSGGAEFAVVKLTSEVPAAGRLQVELVDAANGKSSAAVVGLYSRDHQLVVPSEALSFESGGFRYQQNGQHSQPKKFRPYQQVRYWPGGQDQQRVFFVDGGFSVEIPAGDYTVIAGKGFEYAPQVKPVRIEANAEHTEVIRLERWIDMPARGWYSGDGHVHYERSTPHANERLMVWAKSEDVHVANVMRMGDALQTYFDQYAFGTKGRYIDGEYALVPGQEDPRTSDIGHTLHLNIREPVRIPDEYYLYDQAFDALRRQGGLSGYAHVYQPAAMGFWVQRDMTMNLAHNRVDFAEISEFGDIDTTLYYEFLNLGFRLTASAGSDVPWGHSIGSSRVYAYTGPKFDVDSWFQAVRAGHTFVTTGPMVEFTVNGRIPGSEIQAAVGDELHIKARASGHSVLPRYLEIVSQGDIVRGAHASPDEAILEVEFTLPVKGSTWLAARSFGAHTSPVYVRVGENRFWKLEKVEELVGIRMEQLDAIDSLTQKGVAVGGPGGWNGPEALSKSTRPLLERVAAARAIYEELLRQAKRELASLPDRERQN